MIRDSSTIKNCFLPPKLYSRRKNTTINLKLAVLIFTMNKIKKEEFILYEKDKNREIISLEVLKKQW